jgi:pimeloyl-ACP methyl ester carboxylesterase
VSPPAPAPPDLRFKRADIVLDDGHRVGVSICGEGIPFVMIHALGGEGLTYTRALDGIVRLGFKVITIDTAGHGRTDRLGRSAPWADYVDLHRRTLHVLGIDQAVFAGHSMGGKLALDLAAADPERALAVFMVNAPIGRVYDRFAGSFRRVPLLMPVGAGLLATDIVISVARSSRNTFSNLGTTTPGWVRRARAVANVPSAFFATIGHTDSGSGLRALRQADVPTAVIHGDRDLAVWFPSARDAADASGATLVRVHRGSHIWILDEADTFSGIVAELLDSGFAEAIDERVRPGTGRPQSVSRRRQALDRAAPSRRGPTWSLHERRRRRPLEAVR